LLYRGTSANFNNAVEISVVAGSSYFDQFPGGEPILYFYWIKFVSVNGTYGDVIGPASCWANPTITDMMQLLTDKIDRGVLAQSLKTEIDRISWLADGLTQEATYRAADDATLADAFNGLQASFDSTVSLVLTETHLRSTADSSLAQQITTVQSQLGNNLASVQTLLQTNITTTNGRVTSIGALWTAKVSVNGLIGGFGVYNDGQEVQAGFDVDLFWVGRTNANKVKPFIISEGVTYIDNAMIRQLTADKIDTRNLTVKDSLGNVILGSGISLNPTYAADGTRNSDLTASIASAAQRAIWANVSGANRPEDNATWGADFDKNMKGKINGGNIWTYIEAGVIGTAFIGDAAISNAKIGNASVDTLKVAGQSITVSGQCGGTGWQDFHLNAPHGGTINIVAYNSGSTNGQADTLYVHVNGGVVNAFRGIDVEARDDYGNRYWASTGAATEINSIGVGGGNHHIAVYSSTYFRVLGILTMR
jgi:hypothetical protein